MILYSRLYCKSTIYIMNFKIEYNVRDKKFKLLETVPSSKSPDLGKKPSFKVQG